METILVSKCLTGAHCLYHGRYATFAKPSLRRLEARFPLLPVCPEMLGGLPCPRPPTRRRKDGRLYAAGQDVTPAFERGRDIVLETIAEREIVLALLLEKSPACDPVKGVTGSALVAAGIPCIAAWRGGPWIRELKAWLAGAPDVQECLFPTDGALQTPAARRGTSAAHGDMSVEGPRVS